MRYGLAFVVLGFLAFFLLRELEGWGGTYRPSVQPLGWTADGTLLFVHREVEGGYDWRNYSCGASGLYALRDELPVVGLVTGPGWCDRVPQYHDQRLSVSRDGATLFAAGGMSRDHCGEVLALDVARRQTRQVWRDCSSQVGNAAISPGGRWMVAHRSCSELFGGGEPPRVLPAGCVDRDARLSLIPLNGGAIRSIGGEKLRDPVWSPDGRSIVAVAEDEGEIVHLDVATCAQRVVTKGGHMAWSPDGRWIAFTRSQPGDNRSAVSVRIIRSDGTGERVLFTDHGGWFTNLETRANGMPHSPIWSPDGRRIVFVRRHNRGETLWSVNVDGTGLRRLTRPIPKA